MIISLISMKESESNEHIDLSDLRNQINAIRIVHEKLYSTGDFERITMQSI